MALLTLNDFAPYKAISSNIDSTERLIPYVDNAQLLDLKPLLGEALYYDLITNPTTTANAKLLNGGTYLINNMTVKFVGIKAALVYFAYSRFLENQGVSVTRFGVVSKLNGDVSENVSDKTLMRHVNNAKEIGKAYFDECRKYLNYNSTSYPLWLSMPTQSTQRNTGVRITAIGGNSTDDRCTKCNRVNCCCHVVI